MFGIQATFTAAEAATLARFFHRLATMVEDASRVGDFVTVCGLCEMTGRLQIRVFGFAGVDTLFDAPDVPAAAEEVEEEEYRGPDMDAAYERQVEIEMGCD